MDTELQMKEKLKEIIENWCKQNEIDSISDYLIDHNCIALPCKVGQTVYMPWKYEDISGIAILTVVCVKMGILENIILTDLSSDDEDFMLSYSYGVFDFNDLGTKIFLTYEEAEKVLTSISD